MLYVDFVNGGLGFKYVWVYNSVLEMHWICVSGVGFFSFGGCLYSKYLK